MAQPLRIYISSTFSDLEPYREAVYKALRKLRHDVIAMEDYVATDKRPLDKCLADVESCDVYVGIFAWRYGYIPEKDNPKQKSITEREFRHAVEKGKPCLIFLLAEEAPWPKTLMEKGTDETQLEALRKELAEAYAASFFHSQDKLAELVVTAVTRWKDEQPTILPSAKPLGPGALINVPDLPPHFLPRPEDVAALKQAVLATTNQPTSRRHRDSSEGRSPRHGRHRQVGARHGAGVRRRGAPHVSRWRPVAHRRAEPARAYTPPVPTRRHA